MGRFLYSRYRVVIRVLWGFVIGISGVSFVLVGIIITEFQVGLVRERESFPRRGTRSTLLEVGRGLDLFTRKLLYRQVYVRKVGFRVVILVELIVWMMR